MLDGVEQSADSKRFRLRSVDRCVRARADLPADTLVLDADTLSPAELADLVLRRV